MRFIRFRLVHFLDVRVVRVLRTTRSLVMNLFSERAVYYTACGVAFAIPLKFIQMCSLYKRNGLRSRAVLIFRPPTTGVLFCVKKGIGYVLYTGLYNKQEFVKIAAAESIASLRRGGGVLATARAQTRRLNYV